MIYSKLIDMGYSCIPVYSDGTKRPAVRWKPFQYKMPSKDDLALFKRISAFADGVGVLCGRISGGLECLDFDNPLFFAKFRDSLERGRFSPQDSLWIMREMDTPRSQHLYLEQTPSGGFHLLYRCQGPIGKSQKLACDRDGTISIETRGEGSYVVVAPTKGYHPVYSPLPPLVPLDVRIIGVLKRHTRSLHQGSLSNRERPVYSCYGDQTALYSEVYALLLQHGWRYCGTYEDKVKLCRPGKRPPSVSALWSQERGTLYVFSTNAHPFEANRLYSSQHIKELLTK